MSDKQTHPKGIRYISKAIFIVLIKRGKNNDYTKK